MIEENHIYAFKKKFCKILKIPDNQAERRLSELLDWLTNYFDFEFYKGNPHRIFIKKIYGDYQPLPKKPPKQDELNQLKKERYDEYTKNQFSKDEYVANSITKVSREAIGKFGNKEFGHTSVRSVANTYIKESFHKYGENNNHFIWVYYPNYKLLEPDILADWAEIRRQEKIDDSEAANAFYAQENGEDISEQKNAYKAALDRFKMKYGKIPVCVKEWRLKECYRMDS